MFLAFFVHCIFFKKGLSLQSSKNLVWCHRECRQVCCCFLAHNVNFNEHLLQIIFDWHIELSACDTSLYCFLSVQGDSGHECSLLSYMKRGNPNRTLRAVRMVKLMQKQEYHSYKKPLSINVCISFQIDSLHKHWYIYFKH